MSFCVYDSNIAICTNERVVICDTDNDSKVVIDLPDFRTTEKMSFCNNLDIESCHAITNTAFSKDGRFLLVCTNRTRLYLYERKGTKLLSQRTLVRAASKVRFSPKNEIIVADKAGDVYVYSTEKPMDKGTYVMGHLSMLLDVLVTDDESYILTTDRDEKIRVSLFPNSYNIQSYCLGHKKFVSNISELPHDKSILVSTGGDGFVLLWDYKHGRQLLSINISDKVSKDDVDMFNKNLKVHNLDEHVEALPVKHLVLSALDEAMSLMFLTFWCCNKALLYTISGDRNTPPSEVYIQSVILEDEPLECHARDTDIWVLTELGIKIYEFKDRTLKVCDRLVHKLSQVNNSWTTLRKSTSRQDLFPVLYKRKYDNVQEYLDKKKSRSMNKSE